MKFEFDISKISIPDGAMVTKAVYQSMNKATAKANTAMKNATRKVYNIKAKDLNKTVVKKNATAGKTEVSVVIRSRPISLSKFSPTKVNVKGKNGRTYKGVSVKVKKSGGKTRVRGAFFGKAKNSGSEQIFSRRGKGRLPLRKLAVYTTPTMVNKEGDDVFFREFKNNFSVIYDKQLKYLIGKRKRK